MLKEGDKAPGFSVTSTGGDLALSDFKGKIVVLYFYPKDMTSGCTAEACDFRDNLSLLKKKKAVVLGVSKDSVERHRAFQKKEGFDFPLLADTDGELCEAYGVWKEKSLYGRKYMGIERTTFVIDARGRIAKIFPKVKVKGHVEEVLKALTEL